MDGLTHDKKEAEQLLATLYWLYLCSLEMQGVLYFLCTIVFALAGNQMGRMHSSVNSAKPCR